MKKFTLFFVLLFTLLLSIVVTASADVRLPAPDGMKTNLGKVYIIEEQIYQPLTFQWAKVVNAEGYSYEIVGNGMHLNGNPSQYIMSGYTTDNTLTIYPTRFTEVRYFSEATYTVKINGCNEAVGCGESLIEKGTVPFNQ